jgi:hypothetical protein
MYGRQARAGELRGYYRGLLGELIPLTVEHLLSAYGGEGAAARRHLELWRDRLLSAAGGEEPEGCRPLSLAEVRRALAGADL